MKNRVKLGLLWIGALALSLTLANAEAKGGNSPEGMMYNDKKQEESHNNMKYNNDKNQNSQKDMMNNDGKCNADKKPKKEPKPAPMEGKCGPGKCG